MNDLFFWKMFGVTLISLIYTWVMFSRYYGESRVKKPGDGRQRYLPLVSGAPLPTFFVILLVIWSFFGGVTSAGRITLSACFSIFLHISLYYALLMPLLPLLRKHISARACAILWLLPNYLYLAIYYFMGVAKPLFVLRIPGSWVWIIFGIWFTGFASVLLWKITSHLLFRKRILTGAYPVTDQVILDLWKQEITDAGIRHPNFPLVISPNVSSPLTVGLFHRSLNVILPEQGYSPTELRLIFRHEIIHIGREDSWSKFFLMFCTAMCWFNPMMWAAMRKCAEDLELSCDETTLLDADEETRRQYAELLLSSAGDGRGFTTCLSAAASSMRYRLKSVVKPRGRRSGAIFVGLTLFTLFVTCGHVALAYGDTTGEDVLFRNQDHSQFELRNIYLAKGSPPLDIKCTDVAALREYLSGLELEHLTGNYSLFPDSGACVCFFDTPEGYLSIYLTDHMLKVEARYEGAPAFFYVPQGVDWGYLSTIIEVNPI